MTQINVQTDELNRIAANFANVNDAMVQLATSVMMDISSQPWQGAAIQQLLAELQEWNQAVLSSANQGQQMAQRMRAIAAQYEAVDTPG